MSGIMNGIMYRMTVAMMETAADEYPNVDVVLERLGHSHALAGKLTTAGAHPNLQTVDDLMVEFPIARVVRIEFGVSAHDDESASPSMRIVLGEP